MKYEAEIIKDIVDSRGHTKTSIHYQSECVEEWVKEVEGAYPKLCDYQPEWLNYSAENKVGVFPYTTLTDVTSATVENVVPYAYKSAILKGQTLVNLCKLSGMNKPNPSREDMIDIPLHHLKENTQYTVIVNVLESSDTAITVGFLGATGGSWKGVVRNISISSDMKMLITTGTGLGNKLRIHNNTSTGTLTVKNAIVLEGDYTNQDIPYFEGMQSVKVPVLTTTGKNLWDGELEEGIYNIVNGSKTDKADYFRSSDFIRIQPNTNIMLSNESNARTYKLFYDEQQKIISATNANPFTTPSNSYYMTFYFDSDGASINDWVQIEQGSLATTYEPYKSNILSTPSDLELRGIGEVRDEMNCLTGQVTERLNEIVIDGTVESTINIHQPSNSELLTFRLGNVANDGIVHIQSMSDKLSWNNTSGLLNYPYSFRLAPYGNPSITCLFICLPKSILSEESANGLMEWLANNPVKIQYPLATPVVKTVDLNVADQDGKSLKQIKPIEGTMHLNTSGENIEPLFSGEIPVEAITQNLASFIEE